MRHEDYRNAQEEQQQWKKCVDHTRNTYATIKEWMEEDQALSLASKLGLNSNSELKSISLLNISDPSLEETLDKTNLGETPVDFEKGDHIDEPGNYFLNTLSDPCSHEKSPGSFGLSNSTTHEIFNTLIIPVHKIIEREVVDAYVYHTYC
jgi:hypothetical protein